MELYCSVTLFPKIPLRKGKLPDRILTVNHSVKNGSWNCPSSHRQSSVFTTSVCLRGSSPFPFTWSLGQCTVANYVLSCSLSCHLVPRLWRGIEWFGRCLVSRQCKSLQRAVGPVLTNSTKEVCLHSLILYEQFMVAGCCSFITLSSPTFLTCQTVACSFMTLQIDFYLRLQFLSDWFVLAVRPQTQSWNANPLWTAE